MMRHCGGCRLALWFRPSRFASDITARVGPRWRAVCEHRDPARVRPVPRRGCSDDPQVRRRAAVAWVLGTAHCCWPSRRSHEVMPDRRRHAAAFAPAAGAGQSSGIASRAGDEPLPPETEGCRQGAVPIGRGLKRVAKVGAEPPVKSSGAENTRARRRSTGEWGRLYARQADGHRGLTQQ